MMNIDRKESRRVRVSFFVFSDPQKGQYAQMFASGSKGASWTICLQCSRSFSEICTRTPPMALEISQSICTMYSSRIKDSTPPAASCNLNRWASSVVLNLATVINWLLGICFFTFPSLCLPNRAWRGGKGEEGVNPVHFRWLEHGIILPSSRCHLNRGRVTFLVDCPESWT